MSDLELYAALWRAILFGAAIGCALANMTMGSLNPRRHVGAMAVAFLIMALLVGPFLGWITE